MIWRRKSKKADIEPLTFERLLVVCTGDADDAELIATACDLAAEWKSTITLLSVLETPAELGWLARAAGTSVNELTERMIREQEEKLRALAESAGLPVPPAVHVRMGKAFLEVIRHAIDHKTDLVLKTAERLAGVEGFLFASTDQHLLRKCPCAVWLRLPDTPRKVKTVLAAVDVNHAAAAEPETLAGLNRRILETAAKVATAEGAQVHMLHVWDAPGEGFVRMWSNAPDPEKTVDTYIKEVEANHARALDTLADQARVWIGAETAKRIKLVPRLERGAARDVIPEQVHALGVDVIVMGTIARTGVPGFVIGNTAEDILNSVDCAVVTVKPPNYVSPVRGDTHS